MDRTAQVLAIALTIVSVLMMFPVLVDIELAGEYGVSILLGISAAFAYYFTQGISDLFVDCGQSFLFAALGVWIAWRQISGGTTSGTMNNIEYIKKIW